jgi:iron(III) transport system permease protein
MRLSGPRDFLLFTVGVLLALPVAVVLGSWLEWNAHSTQILGDMAATVLPRYAATSVVLCLAVGAGVALVGTATAACVTLFDFPGRRSFEWLLLLPLAMPAYVVAYAYTDFLQFSGPLQGWMRAALGREGRMLPEIRSVGGAVWVFVFVLYPYVYLLARAALGERAGHLMEAARLLGAPLRRRIIRVAVPLARPAVAAGVALALMETLADFGVASYFGIQTFTTGIYQAWLAMDDRIAAAQLATSLLVLVALLLALEHRSQKRLRFSTTRGGRVRSPEAEPVVLRGGRAVMAWLVCGLPILMGFVLPVAFMLRPLAADWSVLPWNRFLEWGWNSVRLGGVSAVLAVLLSLTLAFNLRRRSNPVTRAVARLAALGYAVPGAVIVIGLLLPLAWLQQVAPQTSAGYWITGTVVGVVWAYLVRFMSVALQSVQSGYARIPISFDDTARMLGVDRLALLRRVHWPLLRRSVAAAGLLVFVDVMKELPATMLLRPFNTDTLAVVAYQLARDERLGEAALPSLALVLVGLLPVLLLSRTLRTAR